MAKNETVHENQRSVIKPETLSQISVAQRVDDKVDQFLSQLEATANHGRSWKEQLLSYVMMLAAFALGAIAGNPALLPGVA